MAAGAGDVRICAARALTDVESRILVDVHDWISVAVVIERCEERCLFIGHGELYLCDYCAIAVGVFIQPVGD